MYSCYYFKNNNLKTSNNILKQNLIFIIKLIVKIVKKYINTILKKKFDFKTELSLKVKRLLLYLLT